MRLLPEKVSAKPSSSFLLPPIGQQQPAIALDEVLRGVEARFGRATRNIVAMQLEYPGASPARFSEPGDAMGRGAGP